jgi:hypothetical protein
MFLLACLLFVVNLAVGYVGCWLLCSLFTSQLLLLLLAVVADCVICLFVVIAVSWVGCSDCFVVWLAVVFRLYCCWLLAVICCTLTLAVGCWLFIFYFVGCWLFYVGC